MPAGIPQAIKDLTVKFHYNDVDSLRQLFEKYPGQIACVVLEAATSVEPKPGFLHDLQTACHDAGALFYPRRDDHGIQVAPGRGAEILWRRARPPTFGKAMANGFALSALLGKREIMELGGLFHEKERVFLLSTTHGAENHALAAGLKTMEIYEKERVVDHLWEKGTTLRDGLNRVTRQLGLEEYFQILGRPCNLVFATRDQEKQPSQAFRALFMQETIKRGLLMPSLVISFSHTDADIAKTIEGIGEALEVYGKALREGAAKYLTGRPVKPVFRPEKLGEHMRAAIVQTNPVFGAKEENIDLALSMMASVSADLYVLPELFASGYNFVDVDEVRGLAEPVQTGRTFEDMSRFAHDAGCYVVYGFAESHKGDLYNSAAIVGFDGTCGLYRKVHLFDREKLFFAPGDLGFPVFETAIGRIGLMICFDWYFPESARTLALKGAQVIAHPANLVLPNCPDGMRTRCLENRVFALTANRIGTEQRGDNTLTFIGQSQITSVRGEILHRSPVDEPEIAVKEIEPGDADDKHLNERNDLFDDRKLDAYVCISSICD